MSYDSRAIANYFLDVAKRNGVPLDQMKLQKLVYYAHGWYLAVYGKRLINEQVEAWEFGPVIPSLYKAFGRFGRYAIDTKAAELNVDDISGSLGRNIVSLPDGDDSTRKFLDKIWTEYGKYSSVQLANATHAVGTPWHQVMEKYAGEIPRGTDIPDELMADHFTGLAPAHG